jgi:hypothetical protein
MNSYIDPKHVSLVVKNRIWIQMQKFKKRIRFTEKEHKNPIITKMGIGGPWPAIHLEYFFYICIFWICNIFYFLIEETGFKLILNL